MAINGRWVAWSSPPMGAERIVIISILLSNHTKKTKGLTMDAPDGKFKAIFLSQLTGKDIYIGKIHDLSHICDPPDITELEEKNKGFI